MGALHRRFSGFTMVEIMCTISIIFLVMAGIFKIYDTYQERDKLYRTSTELCKLMTMLEEYRDLHGDYPKIAMHDDGQGDILNRALHGEIDSDGNVIENDRIDLVRTTFREINGKFVDPFLSDYIYYYKLRSNENDWKNSSFILLSKGAKGQQNSKRDRNMEKCAVIGRDGQISDHLGGDLVITNGGFL
jgi:type II secretory pathway pseudopilin PulG